MSDTDDGFQPRSNPGDFLLLDGRLLINTAEVSRRLGVEVSAEFLQRVGLRPALVGEFCEEYWWPDDGFACLCATLSLHFADLVMPDADIPHHRDAMFQRFDDFPAFAKVISGAAAINALTQRQAARWRTDLAALYAAAGVVVDRFGPIAHTFLFSKRQALLNLANIVDQIDANNTTATD